MSDRGEWKKIGEGAYELFGVGVHYIAHQRGDDWVARGFSLRDGITEVKEAEGSAPNLDDAKRIAQQWQFDRRLRGSD